MTGRYFSGSADPGALLANTDSDFVDPPWAVPLDGASVLRAVPDDATIAGMFLSPMAEAGRAAGKPLPSARERYTGFTFYPLREHVQLLLESAEALFPRLPLRAALRKLGRAAPKVMLTSTVGKVTMGAAEGVPDVLGAMSKIIAVYLKPSHSEVIDVGERSLVVRMRDIHFFLDSHYPGIYEGAMGLAGVRGRVKIRTYSETEGDLLCAW